MCQDHLDPGVVGSLVETAEILAEGNTASHVKGQEVVPLTHVCRELILGMLLAQLRDHQRGVLLNDAFLASSRSQGEELLSEKASKPGVVFVIGVKQRDKRLRVPVSAMLGEALVAEAATVDVVPGRICREGRLVWRYLDDRTILIMQFFQPLMQPPTHKIHRIGETRRGLEPWSRELGSQRVQENIAQRSADKEAL